MTQQRTYAGEVEKFLTSLSKESTYPDKAYARSLLCSVRSAVHFFMPDGGHILDDGLKGLAGLKVAPRLPYPTITISTRKTLIRAEGDISNEETLFVEQGMARLFFICSQIPESRIHVQLIDYSDGYWWVGDYATEIEILPSSDRPNVRVIPKISSEVNDKEELVQIEFLCESVGKTVCELLEALSCKNVTHEPLPRSKVRSLLSRNKNLPDYETRVLVINASKASGGSKGGGGTHASPRQHLRRGHIRRLESGNIWVNSCVVGSEGCIKKEYHVL